MIWFTSDLHLGHENIIGYSHRPFENAEAMGVAIIRGINDTVGAEDTLWVLGDVCMGRDKVGSCSAFLSQLVCQDVRLVKGNHDLKDGSLMLEAGFAEVYDLTQIGVGGRQRVTLCHYPLLSWDKRAHGSMMLHGHIHSEGMGYNEENRKNGVLRYDVGVDANGYAPVSIDDIKRFFDGVCPVNPYSNSN